MAGSIATQAILATAETSLNKLLTMDSTAITQLAALEGNIIAIQSTTPNYTLFITPTEQGLFLTTESETTADVKITAPPPLLLQLLLSKQKQRLLHDSNIMIVGKSSLIYHFFTILDNLNPDWGDELSQWLGPVPATLLVQSVKLGNQQLQNGLNLVQNQLASLFGNITSVSNDKFATTNPITSVLESLQKKFRQP